MKYFTDTEFIEYPCTIDLISIGIVSEDDRTFYAINTDFDSSKASDWVKENIISQLPEPETCNLWMPKVQIPTEILNFIGNDKPEFWGYYSDYDWVVFCWLFGSMIDLPDGFPMYCKDLKQLLDDNNLDALPEPKGEHNALIDAKWNKELYEYIKEAKKEGD